MKKAYPALLLPILFACNNQSAPAKEDSATFAGTRTDTLHPVEDHDHYAGDPDNPNMERPGSSMIKTTLDTLLLFKIWVSDFSADALHADFEISGKNFFIVDFDGDGAMPYKLEDSSLTIHYPDFIRKGRIVALEADTLKIGWDEAETPTVYTVWKN